MLNQKKYLLLILIIGLIFTFSVPVNAANVSSVQHGSATSNGNGTVSVTLPTAVDPTKAFLMFQTRHSSNRPVGSMMRGRILNGTTLQFVRVTNETSTINIQWSVVEFSSGVRVQRGQSTQSSSTVNATIPSAVASTSQAFVTWSKTPAAGDGAWSSDDPLTGRLTSTTNVQFRANAANNNHIIWWQVIEFTNAADINVQTGATSMSGGTGSVTVNLPTSVDLTKSFSLVGFRSQDSGSDVGERTLRARLTSSNQLTIDRDRTGDQINEIIWQVIELNDGSTVQSGSERFNNNDSQETVNLATAVDTNKAIAFASVQPVGGQNMGKARYNSDDIIGAASVTMALSSNSIDMRRNFDTDRAEIGWHVVEFNGSDIIPPTISSTSATCPAKNQVTVTFSEDLELTSAVNITNYSLDNGATISSASLSGNVVTLNTSVLTDVTSYTLTVNNVTDLAGNPIVANSTSTFAVNCTSLVAHYRLDEETWNGTAGEIKDFLGNYNGVAVSQATPVYPGKICSGAYIPYDDNDADQYAVDTGIDVDAVLGNTGTINFWYQSDTDWNGGGDRVLFDASLGNKYFYFLIMNDGSLRFGLEDSNDGDFRFNTPQYNYTASDWVHVGVTWDLPNDRLEIYVNGNLVATDTRNTNGVLGNMNTLYFGDNRTTYHPGGTANSAQGRIDEIYIYNTAVNQAQMQTDMNATHACTAIACSYRDDFTTSSFSNNDGSLNWAGDWTEIDPAVTGPGSGYVSISGGDLVLQNNNPSESNSQPGVIRGFSLNGATDATFTYTYKLTGGVENIDQAIIQVSDDGGTSWTTIETINNKTDGIYTNRVSLSAFPALSLTSNMQVAISINDEVTVGNTGCCYGGGGETISFLYFSIYPAGMCTVSTLNHIEFVHDGAALTCNPEQVTVKACADASCSTLVTSAVTANLTPTGWVGGNSKTFTGSANYNLQKTTVGTVTLGTSSTAPAASSTVVCKNSSGTVISCDMVFSDSGFLISETFPAASPAIPTQTSCQTSSNILVSAVKKSPTTEQCIPFFNGKSATLKFWTGYSNPASGTRQATLNYNATNYLLPTASPGIDVPVTFDANGQFAFTINYPDAGQLDINTSYTGSVATSDDGLVMSGNTIYLTKPAKFYVYSDDANAACPSADPTNADCNPAFKKSGENFNLKLRAACSDNSVTPNFQLNGMTVNSNLVQPAGGSNATIGVTTYNFVAGDNGEHVISNQNVDEVGVFTFTTALPAGGYFGETVIGTPALNTSANIGRFTPDHFDTMVTHGCTGGSNYTYSGQPFTVVAYARKQDNNTAVNYRNGFAFGVTLSDSNSLGTGSFTNNTISSASFTSAIEGGTIGAGTQTDLRYTFTNKETVPGTIKIKATDVTDTLITSSTTEGTTEVRSGRTHVENAYGSELTDLPVTAQVEYYTSNGFTINTTDTCSTISVDLTDIGGAGDPVTVGDGSAAGQTCVWDDDGESGTDNCSGATPGPVASQFEEPPVSGSFNLFLKAPGADNTGDIGITLTSPSWLQYDWDGDTNHDNDPSGTASFGLYRGDDRIIYQREVFN